MSIQYSGGTIVNSTFVGTARSDIASNLITQLLSAGWTNHSGSGTDQVLKCVADASGRQAAVRIFDPGSGNCTQVFLRNVAGTRISQIFYLLPAALKTFRVIANQYQFFIMTAGASPAREFVAGGQLWVPSWLSISTNCCWMQGTGTSDSDTTAISSRPTFRSFLCTHAGSTIGSRSSNLVGDTLLDIPPTATTVPAAQRFSIPAGAYVGTSTHSSLYGYRWRDDTVQVVEPLLAMGLASNSDEAKIQGQLYDAILVADSFAADATITLDGHTWWAITNNNAGTSDFQRGTLFVMVA